MASEHVKTRLASEVAPEVRSRAPALENDLQRTIGTQLRAMYDDILYQPVPDQFLTLLQELERSEAAATRDSAEES